MGLDSFLTGKLYVGGNHQHRGINGEIKIYQNENPLLVSSDISDIHEISFNVAYWRKSNMIHKWFVDNVQNGVDDCREYYVGRDKLERLLQTCKRVLEAFKSELCWVTGAEAEDAVELARKLLPTQDGFFFGSTSYDEYYVQDLEETIEKLENVLNNPRYEGCQFYYQSSW